MIDVAYERRKRRRQLERERAFHGETLAQYHARETAKPPTLAEIFAKNRADKAVCTATPDLFAPAKETAFRTVRGEQHGRAKLTMWDVIAIRLVFEEPDPPSIEDVARAFSLDRRSVRSVRDRINWKWLP